MAREYTPGRMVLAAAGAIEHERVVEAADKALGALASGEAPMLAAAAYTGGERRLKRRLEQANVMLGFPGVSFRDPAYFATHMFAQALGGGLTSRLWYEVRETRGLAYSIDAFHWPFSDCGLFGIGAGTSGSDLAELVDLVSLTSRQTVGDLQPEELARAKAQLKVSLLASLETPGGRIERVARQLLAWGRIITPDETVAHVDKVTVEEAREAGRRALAGPITLAAIGPIKTLPSTDHVLARLAA